MVEISELQVPQISVDEVNKALDLKDKILLLDVRTSGEYSRGKIEGSINLPVEEVDKQIESVIPDKSAKIYVYCLSGSRSIIAVDTMIKIGYVNVFNVTSGLLAWRVNGYKVT